MLENPSTTTQPTVTSPTGTIISVVTTPCEYVLLIVVNFVLLVCMKFRSCDAIMFQNAKIVFFP